MAEKSPEAIIENVPVLPIREDVIFPLQTKHLFVGRKASIASIRAAEASGRRIVLVAQRNIKEEGLTEKDFYSVGTLCLLGKSEPLDAAVIEKNDLPPGTIEVAVKGRDRATIRRLFARDQYFTADIEAAQISEKPDEITVATLKAVRLLFMEYADGLPNITKEMIGAVTHIDDVSIAPDAASIALDPPFEILQDILQTFSPRARLEKLAETLQSYIKNKTPE